MVSRKFKNTYVTCIWGDNFGKDGEREMKVNDIREQNFSLLEKGL